MEYIYVNRHAWNQRTKLHVKSDFYNVAGFLEGNNSLNHIELSELGDVSNKSLLHLQCHFGLDTLSWARLGARVTGVDLSPEAINNAITLAKNANIPAHFVCDDLYRFGERCSSPFDIVFTSYGVLCWLPKLQQWAEVIANQLKPGGTFYMAEFHPVHDLVRGQGYFHNPQACLENEGTYTENAGDQTADIMTWQHSLGDVINALLNTGLQLIHVNEYPYSPYPCFENMQEKQPGRYYFTHQDQTVPLLYTIKAIKPNK